MLKDLVEDVLLPLGSLILPRASVRAGAPAGCGSWAKPPTPTLTSNPAASGRSSWRRPDRQGRHGLQGRSQAGGARAAL